MDKVYNFCAGPAMIPADVMAQAQQELIDWQGLGTSVMEISHRSKEFLRLLLSQNKIYVNYLIFQLITMCYFVMVVPVASLLLYR